MESIPTIYTQNSSFCRTNWFFHHFVPTFHGFHKNQTHGNPLDVIFWLSGVQFSSVLLRTCQVGTFRGWPLRTQLSNQFGRDLLSFCCIRGGGEILPILCGDSKLTIVRIPINQPGFHSSRSRDLPPEIHEYSQINLGPIIFGDQTMRRYERFYGIPPMIVHCWGISPKVFWVVEKFHPESWGKWCNLRIIFFRWVVQPRTSNGWKLNFHLGGQKFVLFLESSSCSIQGMYGFTFRQFCQHLSFMAITTKLSLGMSYSPILGACGWNITYGPEQALKSNLTKI